MEKQEYQKLVKNISPKPNKIKDGFVSFIIGGLIGSLGVLIANILQTWFDLSTKDAGIWMLIIVIFIASLFTALGFFDKWVGIAKSGLIVPITGFAHSVTSAALDYKKDGLITGLGSNFFKLAGCVLLYGILSAFILVVVKAVYLCLV